MGVRPGELVGHQPCSITLWLLVRVRPAPPRRRLQPENSSLLKTSSSKAGRAGLPRCPCWSTQLRRDGRGEERLDLLEIDASFGRAEIRYGPMLRGELHQPRLAVVIQFSEGILTLFIRE